MHYLRTRDLPITNQTVVNNNNGQHFSVKFKENYSTNKYMICQNEAEYNNSIHYRPHLKTFLKLHT